MKSFLLVTELLSGIILIITILMHSPKGDGLGSLGGASQTYSSTSKNLDSGLHRFTTIVAIIFLIVATILGLYY